MKFKSKSQLWEHIIMLKEAGYLVEKQLTEPLADGRTRIQKVYAVNFYNTREGELAK